MKFVVLLAVVAILAAPGTGSNSVDWVAVQSSVSALEKDSRNTVREMAGIAVRDNILFGGRIAAQLYGGLVRVEAVFWKIRGDIRTRSLSVQGANNYLDQIGTIASSTMAAEQADFAHLSGDAAQALMGLYGAWTESLAETREQLSNLL